MRRVVFPLFVLVAVTQATVSYQGYSVLRIIPNNGNDVMLLKSLETKYEVWKEARHAGEPCDVMINEWSRPILDTWLQESGMEYSVMIEDVGAVIGRQAQQHKHKESRNFDYSRYHTLDEINQWIDDIAAEYSSMVQTEVIAYSYEQRPITLMKISTGGGDKPAIWYDSAIHSREWVSPATTLYITNELLRLYGVDSDVTAILDAVDIYFVPIFNVDGYEYTWTTDRLWRKTRSVNEGSLCRGCDPNRNWDIRWGEVGVSTNPCSNTFPGPSPFSEVEVKDVVDYLETVPNLIMYIAVHNYGQMYMTPYGYQATPPPDFNDLIELCEEGNEALFSVHGTVYRCNSLWNLVGGSSGSSVDYAYDVMGVKYSYGIELRDTGTYGFLLPEDQIIPTAEENYAAFIALFKGVLERQ